MEEKSARSPSALILDTYLRFEVNTEKRNVHSDSKVQIKEGALRAMSRWLGIIFSSSHSPQVMSQNHKGDISSCENSKV